MKARTSVPQPTPEPASLGRVAVKLFLAICDAWKLTEQQRLKLAGQSSRTTLRNWKLKVEAGAPLNLAPDTLERLSLIAGIRKGVELLYPREEWDVYPHKPNAAFGGQTLVERMTAGRLIDLYEVRRYLDGERGAHFG
jgi:hypothetical protein